MKQTSEAAQIAYDILAKVSCKYFQEELERATKLINEAISKSYRAGFDEAIKQANFISAQQATAICINETQYKGVIPHGD